MSNTLLRIFGVPIDLGQGRRGVDMGPSAIRYAGLQEKLARLGYQVHDGGNISAPQVEQVEHPYHGDERMGRVHHLPQIAQVCERVYEEASAALKAGERVIFLGGDHSISIGTVAAAAAQGPVGVLWVDAHGDLNTPFTTPSGNVHGMALAMLLGDGPRELTEIGGAGAKITPAQTALVGARDLDSGERERLRAGEIGVWTMREIDEGGMARVAAQILERFVPFERIHVSLDLDGLDPSVAPGVGTPAPGGLSYREAHLLMEILADSGKVRTLDIVEINPIFDRRNQTAKLAVELAAGLFGQRIL